MPQKPNRWKTVVWAVAPYVLSWAFLSPPLRSSIHLLAGKPPIVDPPKTGPDETTTVKKPHPPKPHEYPKTARAKRFYEAVEAGQAPSGDKRTLEIEPWLEVLAGDDAGIDRAVRFAAGARLRELEKRIGGARIRVLVLPKDTDTTEATARLIPAARTLQIGRFDEPSLRKAFAAHPNTILLLLGHQHGGRVFESSTETDRGLSINRLSGLAAVHGVLLLPIGCLAGIDSPIGPIHEVNSVVALERVGTVLGAANAKVLLEGLAGTDWRFRLNPFQFEVPIEVEVVDRQTGDRVTTIYLPLSQVPEELLEGDSGDSWLFRNHEKLLTVALIFGGFITGFLFQLSSLRPLWPFWPLSFVVALAAFGHLDCFGLAVGLTVLPFLLGVGVGQVVNWLK